MCTCVHVCVRVHARVCVCAPACACVCACVCVSVCVTPGCPLCMGIWKKGFLPPPWGWVRGSGAEAAQASWAPVRQQAAALVPRLGAPSWHHTAPTVSLESQALGSGGRSPGALPPLEPWASHSHFWVCFLIHKMGLILSLGAAVTPAPMGRTKQQARRAAHGCRCSHYVSETRGKQVQQ